MRPPTRDFRRRPDRPARRVCRVRGGRRIAAILAALVVLAGADPGTGPARAQVPGAAPAGSAAEETVERPDHSVPAERASARATMRTFLEAVNDAADGNT
ncbi:MAG: hypothetical protein HKN12_10770, partial [Gemmatimonadetes bacterium]|nr:hypothetical protein [Gemmatimonadota bacterium]